MPPGRLAAFMLITAFCAAPLTTMAAERTAILAGGCFWCIEKDFEHVDGVLAVVAGYAGGSTDNPTYRNHTQHGHREVVKITYDDAVVDYARLLDIFWRSVDPTDGGGQFCDRGHSYTTAIYAVDDEQLHAAEKSKAVTEQSGVLGQPIATEVAKAPPFTAAEDYHQDYYRKNPLRYKFYRTACGRNQRVEELWGDAAYTGIKKSS